MFHVIVLKVLTTKLTDGCPTAPVERRKEHRMTNDRHAQSGAAVRCSALVRRTFIWVGLFDKRCLGILSGTRPASNGSSSLQSPSVVCGKKLSEERDWWPVRGLTLLLNTAAVFLLCSALLAPLPLLRQITKCWLIGQVALLPCLVLFETIHQMRAYRTEAPNEKGQR